MCIFHSFLLNVAIAIGIYGHIGQGHAIRFKFLRFSKISEIHIELHVLFVIIGNHDALM